MNFNLQVKEILKETFILTGEINDKTILNNLIDFVKNNKDENLSYKTNVKGHFTGFYSLIQNENFINFLKNIQKNIRIVFKNNFKISEAWGNILKKNEEVFEHTHSCDGISGILYLTDNGPGTFFKEYNLNIEEKQGRYVLFSPNLLHGVRKIDSDIERITVAFNLDSVRTWETENNNLIWVNKNEI